LGSKTIGLQVCALKLEVQTYNNLWGGINLINNVILYIRVVHNVEIYLPTACN